MSAAEQASLIELLTAMADDELILGHRDSEWTGYAPILEEDIAFSNIAQDEIGHSLVWFSILEPLVGRTPDQLGFERPPSAFRCCRFVAFPKGDFAYTVVRQYLFDEAEAVRLSALRSCSYGPLREAAARIVPEEQYHLLHTRGLVERLGGATDESHRRMQAALDAAFPQALGMFERLAHENDLVKRNIFPGNDALMAEWLRRVVPVLTSASLKPPVAKDLSPTVPAENGGRAGDHLPHVREIIDDMQSVFQSEPGASW